MRARVEIKFWDAVGQLTSVSGTDACNVSNVDNLLTESSFRGFRGFHLSESADAPDSLLDGSYKFYSEKGYEGYCSRLAATADLKIVFKKSSKERYLFICFDAARMEWPKAVTLQTADGRYSQVYENINSPYLLVPVKDIEAASAGPVDLLMTFWEWSNPNSGIRVSSVSFGLTESFEDDILQSFKCSESLLDTNLRITPGVMQQYADLTFYDRRELLTQLAAEGLLGENHEVSIYAVEQAESENEVLHLLGVYVSDKWSLSEDGAYVLTGKDPSKNFDHIQVPPSPIKDRTLDEFLDIAFKRANRVWSYIDDETESYCKSIFTPNSWMYGDSLDNVIEKICNFGILGIYWHIDRFIVARCY